MLVSSACSSVAKAYGVQSNNTQVGWMIIPGFVSDVDFESEKWRSLGSLRIDLQVTLPDTLYTQLCGQEYCTSFPVHNFRNSSLLVMASSLLVAITFTSLLE